MTLLREYVIEEEGIEFYYVVFTHPNVVNSTVYSFMNELCGNCLNKGND